MTNSADAEANWSGSTLFAKTYHIRVQEDCGLNCIETSILILLPCVITLIFLNRTRFTRFTRKIGVVLSLNFDNNKSQNVYYYE